MRVLLISMPFGPVDTPSPGLGLLAARLRNDGVDCRQRYFNLDFAAQIGLDDYLGVATQGLTAEWLFSGALFGTEAPDPEGYLRWLQESLGMPAPAIENLRRLRRSAEAFIESCLGLEDWDRFDLIGFTSVFFQNVAALALARRLKRIRPDLTIAFGGANCEGRMGAEMMRSFPFVDLAFSGESDEILPRVVRRLSERRQLDGIPGLSFRRNGRPCFPRKWVQPVEDLDRLPYPEYEEYYRQLELSGLAASVDPVVLLETSRGCWWGARHQCRFCGLNGGSLHYRSKSARRVLDEIRHVARHHGPRIATTDNILDMGYFRSVLPELARSEPKLSLFYETKANLGRHQVDTLAAAGIRSIQPGIESLSTSVLRRMRKGCTGLQNVELLKWCFEYGVWPSWSLIVGFPGEEPEEYDKMARWVPLLAHLPPPANVLKLRLDRFSPYFQHPGKHGLCDVHPMPPYRYIYPFARAVLERLAYFFDYRHQDRRDVWSYARPLLDAVSTHWKSGMQLGALRMRDDGVVLRLHDARSIARRRLTELRGEERQAYLLCETARTLEGLQRELERSHLQSFLGRMVEDGLMLRDEGRFLSLAVTPRHPLVHPRSERSFSYPL